MRLEINDPCNVLLLAGAAERRFHRMEWTLKPFAPSSFLVDGVQRVMQPYKVTRTRCWLGPGLHFM